jgi:hypothetical protein
MEPLSCVNCCHNPLRAGVVGLDFGFCTRHGVVLRAQSESTCGQLLRKDLLVESARKLRATHAKRFPKARVVDLYAPRSASRSAKLVEEPDAALRIDAVVDEAVGYARYEREHKIASLAAMRRIPGIRGEVALAALGRSYVHNCWERDRRWTAGVHVLWWTLERLDTDPSEPLPVELHGLEGLSVPRAVAIAKWTAVALRLYLVSDVGAFAAASDDDVGRLSDLADRALGAVEPGDGPGLVRWLASDRTRHRRALPAARYETIVADLHRSRHNGSRGQTRV